MVQKIDRQELQFRILKAIQGAEYRFIEGLNQRLGLPASLSAMGIQKAWLDDVARLSLEDHCTKTNARTPSEADYRAILDEAF